MTAPSRRLHRIGSWVQNWVAENESLNSEMPLLNIETNLSLEPEVKKALLTSASAKVSEILGKSERYVMVRIVGGVDIAFGGFQQPAAYLQLKSIGLPEDQTQQLSASLCEFINRQLEIPADRIYIEFVDVPRKMWGYNNGTF